MELWPLEDRVRRAELPCLGELLFGECRKTKIFADAGNPNRVIKMSADNSFFGEARSLQVAGPHKHIIRLFEAVYDPIADMVQPCAHI